MAVVRRCRCQIRCWTSAARCRGRTTIKPMSTPCSVILGFFIRIYWNRIFFCIFAVGNVWTRFDILIFVLLNLANVMGCRQHWRSTIWMPTRASRFLTGTMKPSILDAFYSEQNGMIRQKRFRINFCILYNIFEKQRYINMATSVKIVPTLKGRTARRFVKQAEANMKSKKSAIDFSCQVSIAQQILSKSSL